MPSVVRLPGCVILSLAIAGTTVIPRHAWAQEPAPDDPLVVRQELTAVNAAWSRVRLAYDSATAESMLQGDFYAALRDRRVTRAEFIKTISTRSATSRLVRFDNPILTITKGEGPDEWVALVLEKLESERTASDGTRSRSYSLWITRDGYRRTGPSQWQFLYTQEVMRESWSGGRKPPFPDWN